MHCSSGSEIFLGASYEPNLLYDCRGPYFHFVRNKLRQLDIRDKASQLIPPWKCYDELRPGTLILIKASLHIFIFTDNQENIKKKATFSFIHLIDSPSHHISGLPTERAEHPRDCKFQSPRTSQANPHTPRVHNTSKHNFVFYHLHQQHRHRIIAF